LIFTRRTKYKKDWIGSYRKFIKVEDNQDVIRVFEGRKSLPIFGPKDFIDHIKSLYYQKDAAVEIPWTRELAPDIDQIINEICKFYNVTRDDLYKTRRGAFNEPRSVAVYLARIIRLDSLVEISNAFHIEKYSSTSSIIERLKQRMKTEKNLAKRVSTLLENA